MFVNMNIAGKRRDEPCTSDKARDKPKKKQKTNKTVATAGMVSARAAADVAASDAAARLHNVEVRHFAGWQTLTS